MHYQAIVSVQYKQNLIDQRANRPVLGFLVVIGVNCSGFPEAARLAHDEALKQHNGYIRDVQVQSLELTAIDSSEWDAEVLCQISPDAFMRKGVYYVSNLVFLDTLEPS